MRHVPKQPRLTDPRLVTPRLVGTPFGARHQDGSRSDTPERARRQAEYKYTLGDWDHVEKDAGCGETGNRMLTLSYGSSGTQTVNDLVPNWRNIAPCGN